MDILKEKYRNLFENWSFYKNGRFVNNGPDAPKGPEPQPNAEPQPSEAPKEEKPISFEAYRKRYEACIEALRKVEKPEELKRTEAEFSARLENIRKEYQLKVDAAGKTQEAENEKQIAAVRTEIFKQFKIEDEFTQKLVDKVIPNLKLDPKQLKQIDKIVEGKAGDLELTEAQRKQIREVLPVRLFKYDSARGEMIHDQLTNDTVAEKVDGISPKAADIIDDLFDDDSDPLRRYLVQRYDFKANEAGGLLLVNDEGKEVPIKDVRGLRDYIPQDEQTLKNFDKLLGLTDDQDAGTIEEDLAKNGQDGLKTLQAMQQLQAQLNNPEFRNRPGLMESFGMLMQLIAAFRKAFKDGDWETLNDYLTDVMETKDPKEVAKRLEASKKAYRDALSPKEGEKEGPEPDLSDLVKAYLKPRGEQANKIFCGDMTTKQIKESPLGRYRMEAKPAIAEYLTTKLSLGSIQDITELPSGNVDITAYDKKGEKISVEFNPTEKTTMVLKYAQKTSTVDGKEVTEEVKPARKEFVKAENTEQLAKVIAEETGTGGTGPEKEKPAPFVLKARGEPFDKVSDANHTKSKEAFEKGGKEYDEGKYEAALASFNDSYGFEANPLIRINIAKCLKKLGRTEEAMEQANGAVADADAAAKKDKSNEWMAKSAHEEFEKISKPAEPEKEKPAPFVLKTGGEPFDKVNPETEKKAKEAYQKGAREFEETKYEEALASFNDSYGFEAHPLTRTNIAKTLAKLGRNEEAIAQAEGAVKDAEEAEEKDPKNKDTADRTRAELIEVKKMTAPKPPETTPPAETKK